MYIPKVPHFWHVQHEGTKLSTNLRSQWVFIALINIHAKFQLIKTTGTCNTRKYNLALPVSRTDQRMVQIQKFFAVPTILLPLTSVSYQNVGVSSGFELLILTPDGRTDGQTDIRRTIVHFLWKMR